MTTAPPTRALPRPIRESSPIHWAARIAFVAALVALVIYIAGSAKPSTLGNITEACTLAIAAVALNLLLGYNGQISIGHSTFAGLAAFTAGYTVNSWHWNPLRDDSTCRPWSWHLVRSHLAAPRIAIFGWRLSEFRNGTVPSRSREIA